MVTMKDLAIMANVSVSTVSKAFTGAKDIHPETRERIFEIARQTGCYNKFYKGKYPKRIIAVICHEIISSYYAEFVDHLRQKIEAEDNILLVATDDFSPDKQAELIDYFSSYLRVDGIIVFDMMIRLKKSHDTPIVSLFSGIDKQVDTVFVDSHSPIKNAVALLWEYGHRSIAFIGDRYTVHGSRTFQKAMLALNGKEGLAIECSARFEQAGKEGVDRLLQQAPDCTAILCAYDNIAFGAIKQLQAHGKSVPEDVSVIGINDIVMSRYAEPALTTMGADCDAVCTIAFDILQKKLINPHYKIPERIQLKNKLIIRQSVRKITPEDK